MALYDRLMGLEPPKLPVHQFMGVMQEIALGNMTGTQGVTAFGLSAAEATEASTQALLPTCLRRPPEGRQGTLRPQQHCCRCDDGTS